MSLGIYTILPRWTAKFCELSCRIWQNFPR